MKEYKDLNKDIDELKKSIQEIVDESLRKWEKIILSIIEEISEIKIKLNLDSKYSSQYGTNNQFIVKTLLIKNDISKIKAKIDDLINKNSEINLSYILFDTNLLKAINIFNEFYMDRLNDCKILNLSYNNIRDIKALERAKFKNLETLVLSNNKIADISCLTKTDFPYLIKLWLNNNIISDISPLKNTNYNKLELLY